MEKSAISLADVKNVAHLAKLPVSDALLEKFHTQIGSVLGYMSRIQSLPTDSVEETSQVTGLENVFREDVVDRARMFSQEEALANAKRVHEGYFVVGALIHK